MKTSLHIVFLWLIILISAFKCKNNNCSSSNVKSDFQVKTYSISKILSDIDTNIVRKEYVLIIPKNSCEKCREYTFELCEEIITFGKTAMIFIGNYPVNEIICKNNIIRIANGRLERQIEIYGITLMHLVGKDDYKLTYINPTNIESQYKYLRN
ncbi:MAG: hypothetical protein IPO78_02965 [Saprospiraceae bacterium]|nr:hypothetical protein [Saprospiraceae bacterium]MBK9223030.1 hypothetical protein [Saprospiraceae bacterium]MBK9720562.1 hypothetical protein [Saprospiraceae bacterium]